MTLRTIVCGALLAIAGICSAGDMTYTYTGNLFDHNDIASEPSRLVAHFVFDFDHSPQAAENIYAIKHWDVSAAGFQFSQATQTDWARFRFAFDGHMNIVGWGMSDMDQHHWSAFFSESGRFNGQGGAADFVTPYVLGGTYASVHDNPGVWTVSAAPVPEPANYLTLIAGLACMAGLRRQIKARASAVV